MKKRTISTPRRLILGGCKSCGKDPAENHGRGLCGRCYAVEYDAGRLADWPKLTAEDLGEIVAPPAAETPARHPEGEPRSLREMLFVAQLELFQSLGIRLDPRAVTQLFVFCDHQVTLAVEGN